MANQRPTVDVRPATVGLRRGAWVTTSARGMDEPDYEALFAATEGGLAEAGLGPEDAVRSRLTAATRAGRATGSIVRMRRLAIPFPVATSSYIDPGRFAGGSGAILETLAIADAGGRKLAVEHRPSPPPWKVITIGDMAFVTGTTAEAAGLDDQLASIRGRVAERLARGAELLGAPLRVVQGTAYVQHGVAGGDLSGLADRVGLGGLTITIERCEGFAGEGCLIELEVDAVAEPIGASAASPGAA